MAKHTLKRVFFSFITLGSLAFGLSAGAVPRRVILIRHAEKPDVKSDDLSPEGFKRAQALTQLFERQPALVSFGYPAVYFAARYQRGTSSNRSVETLTPLVQKYKQTLQTPFLPVDYQGLVHVLMTEPQLNGKVVMMAWPHGDIPAIAKALGAKAPDHWNPNTFDRIWLLDFSGPDGSIVTFHDLSQNLMPGDSH